VMVRDSGVKERHWKSLEIQSTSLPLNSSALLNGDIAA